MKPNSLQFASDTASDVTRYAYTRFNSQYMRTRRQPPNVNDDLTSIVQDKPKQTVLKLLDVVYIKQLIQILKNEQFDNRKAFLCRHKMSYNFYRLLKQSSFWPIFYVLNCI